MKYPHLELTRLAASQSPMLYDEWAPIVAALCKDIDDARNDAALLHDYERAIQDYLPDPDKVDGAGPSTLLERVEFCGAHLRQLRRATQVVIDARGDATAQNNAMADLRAELKARSDECKRCGAVGESALWGECCAEVVDPTSRADFDSWWAKNARAPYMNKGDALTVWKAAKAEAGGGHP